MDEYNNGNQNTNAGNDGWQSYGNGPDNGGYGGPDNGGYGSQDRYGYGNNDGYQGGQGEWQRNPSGGNGGYHGYNGYNGYGNDGWQGQDYNYGGPARRLVKSPTNRLVCGVCAGIAEYFGWDPTLVRLVWIAVSIIFGAGFLGAVIYFIVAVIMPEA